jgi:hypothetical protein
MAYPWKDGGSFGTGYEEGRVQDNVKVIER